ncbi:MAG TPA: tRNA dihydrouridine synthase DusB [Treponema sp.]|nr:tRNA dihydrouridine synthase DusB [Treponema sp.]
MSLYHPVKIGSLSLDGNVFLAPVAGYSDRAFRSICADCGADFAYTEMVSAEALTRNNLKTEQLMARAPNEKAYAVQIFGGKAQTMADAARIVLEKTTAECIDINGGCPVPKIIKSGAGSNLTANPTLLYDIVSSVVKAVDGRVPVTIKIRTGWDAEHITWKDCAQAALDAGAAAITLHGRTRAQGYEGKADWGKLAELVEFINGRIPVFGSGDVFSPEAAKQMIEQTGCDGIMLARGAMGNPFIFTKIRQFLKTGSYQEIPTGERIEAGFRELDLLVQDFGEKGACLEMRKRFCAYSRGIDGGAALRKQLVAAESVEEYKNIFNSFLGK